MKNYKLTYILVFAFLMAFIGVLNAQTDSLKKEVVVIKAYDPTIEDAFKINAMPGITAPPPANKTFTYSVSEHTFNPPATISPLPVEPYQEASRYALYQNYVSGGFGNYASFYGDLFYNAYTSDEYQLDVYGTHRSSFGNIKLEDGSKSYAPYSKNKLGLSYAKRFKTMELNADLSYSYNSNRFYGFEEITDSVLYTHNGLAQGVDTSAIPGSAIQAFNKQHFSNLAIQANLNSLNTRKDDIQHKSYFKAHTLGDFYTNRESYIAAGTNILFPLMENYAGVEGDLGYLFYGKTSDVLPYRNLDKNNIFIFNLMPYYYMEQDLWKLKLGFNVQLVAEQNEEIKFVPAPDIHFDLDLIEDFLMFYGKVTGSYDVYSYRQLGEINPFMAPNMKAVPVQTPIDFTIGLRGTIPSGFDVNVSTGFGSVNNQYFFVNEIYTDLQTNELKNSNLFEMVYDNGTYFKFDGEIVYHGTDKINAGASVNYIKYTLENLKYAWHISPLTMSVYGGYKVNDKISTKLLYQFRSSAKAQKADGNSKDLKAIHDVSVEGTYAINDRLSGFVRINNLLAQKYYLWNGYPSQKLNALVGATFRF